MCIEEAIEMDSLISSTLEQKIKCEICEKTFATHHNKKQHLKIVHEEIRFFQCNVCDKVFGTKILLTMHINIIHA